MCRGSLRFPGQIYSVLYLVKRRFSLQRLVPAKHISVTGIILSGE